MYKVKEFADLFGVTVATLHHYEKTGLLLPCSVNPDTGYRFYDTSQMADMSLILQLKTLGFSLREIREFQGQRLTYQSKLAILRERAQQLETTIDLFELFQDPQPYRAYVKTVPPSLEVMSRIKLAHYTEIRDVFEMLLHQIAKEGLRLRQPPSYTCRFFDEELQFENNDVEIAIEVQPGSIHPSLQVRQEQTCLCALHYGDYLTLAACYQFLGEYARKRGFEITGEPLEHYIESYGTKDIVTEFITEVRFPITKLTGQ